MTIKNALIMVDLQNDFCTGGRLAVPLGESVVPVANQLQDYFELIIATQDWHPEDHISFASNHAGFEVGDVIQTNGMEQILWPDHCLQNSAGANFHPELNTQKIAGIFQKGIDKNIDSYSAFFDNAHLRSTGLGEYLKARSITDVYILGLATDYCVKYSCLDALKLGFNVYIIADACKGVELKTGDSAQAIQTMQQAGARIIHSTDVIKKFRD